MHPYRTRVLTPLAVALFAVTACSSGGGDNDAGPSTSRPAPTLSILVTNDDGYDAAGIDTVAEALSELPNVEVTVVAPATNQSGTGAKTSPGELSATDQETASGLPATAVAGFPADSVNYALDTMGLEPDLVVAGINEGQNLGPITDVSGTVGAAKTAAARGIPAVAASQGNVDPPDYDSGATYVVDWVTAHRRQLIAGNVVADVVNMNFPTCTEGEIRGVVQVPLATDATGAVDNADCTSTKTSPTTDIEAFLEGYVPVTQLDADGATVTSSTTFPSPDGPSTSTSRPSTTSSDG
jgi:5'-nucleotidase